MSSAAKPRRAGWSNARIKGRLPPQLVRCPNGECGQYIYPQAKTCPHCGGQLMVLRRKQLAALKKAEAALKRLRAVLDAQR